MKITGRQLKQLIKEARQLLNEEEYDCQKDYDAGGLTWEEYQDCLEKSRGYGDHDETGDIYDYIKKNPGAGAAYGRDSRPGYRRRGGGRGRW